MLARLRKAETEEPVGLELADHVVVNDDLGTTIDEMLRIIDAARSRPREPRDDAGIIARPRRARRETPGVAASDGTIPRHDDEPADRGAPRPCGVEVRAGHAAARRARNINAYFNHLGDGSATWCPRRCPRCRASRSASASRRSPPTRSSGPRPSTGARRGCRGRRRRDARRARRRLTERRRPDTSSQTTKDDDVPLDLYLRERDRRPPRQDGRPDQRLGTRRDPHRGSQRSCRLRDAAHHRAVRHRR